MEPARTIIDKLGGERSVAAIAGTALTAPYRWQHDVERGGTGGSIPAKHIPALLAYAAENGIDLSASDFFPAPRAGAPAHTHTRGGE